MQALLVESLGPPTAHRVAELPDPIPGQGELVVDIKAAALNFPDLLVMQGLYQVRPDLPFVPGAEGAGVVSAVVTNGLPKPAVVNDYSLANT